MPVTPVELAAVPLQALGRPEMLVEAPRVTRSAKRARARLPVLMLADGFAPMLLLLPQPTENQRRGYMSMCT